MLGAIAIPALIASHALAYVIGTISNAKVCTCQDHHDFGHETVDEAISRQSGVDLTSDWPGPTSISELVTCDQAARLRELFASEN
jgi:hypothetical protein